MSAAERLDEAACGDRLKMLPEWRSDGASLRREYRFADFAGAFGFMAEVALVAERSQHHPDWTNVYNRVDVSLSTHDAGGITSRDFDLAEAMERVYSSRR